jgi:hypothetical protein
MQESWEELRDGQAFQGQQWREGERGKWANPSLKKGRGIYTPPGIVAVAVLQGWIFRSKFGPDISTPLEKLLRTLRASSRFGAAYFISGRIFRPPPKSAKDFARVVQIWGWIIGPDISIFGRIIRPRIIRPKFGPDNPARKSKQYEKQR